MSNNMYELFKTDGGLEANGIELDYGSFRVTVARAGGENKKFAKILEAKTKPHRRAMQNDMMDPIRAEQIFHEVYAQTVVLNWETKVDDKWKKGIEAPTGDKLLPVTIENIISTFKNLPDLFKDIQTQAQSSALFRETILEEDSKN